MTAFLDKLPFDRWQRGRRTARILANAHRHLAMGERAQASVPPDSQQMTANARTALAHIAAAREIRPEGGPDLDLLEARALFLARRAADALPAAHRAATARPYDVDSRVTHGLVCLALDRLDEAEHEFESVLEEFGGDPDAETGRRAVGLARGQAPVDEHALPDDLYDAAVVLVRCWQAAEATAGRFDALQAGVRDGGADPAVLAAVDSAMATTALPPRNDADHGQDR